MSLIETIEEITNDFIEINKDMDKNTEFLIKQRELLEESNNE